MIMRTADQTHKLFTSVYKEYFTKIADYANYFLNDREEARDISAELFIKLWSSRGSFLTAAQMRSFMYKSTRNACLNRLRTVKKQRRRQYDIIQRFYLSVTTEIIERSTESNEDTLNRVIQSLDTKYQQCILLFYFEKMTYKRMAARLNVSERNLRFFLDKGRGMIKLAMSLN